MIDLSKYPRFIETGLTHIVCGIGKDVVTDKSGEDFCRLLSSLKEENDGMIAVSPKKVYKRKRCFSYFTHVPGSAIDREHMKRLQDVTYV